MRGRTGSVLVVTAAPAIGAPVCAALGRLGLAGVLASTASEAIHRFAEDAPAAVLIDLDFEEMAAEQLVRRAMVCRETHGSPILLLATSPTDSESDAWIARGCAALLPRDGDPGEIAAQVHAHARGAAGS